ncbi:hypothetical protein AbaHEU2_06930 [Acinetobacter baumannii]|nr:hypothetical protein AbaHEU2_06930 [Acinetobacter baumannii]
MLAILKETDNSTTLDPNKFSIYTEEKIKDYWSSGNPFSWHLFLESSLVYSDNKKDFLKSLGKPKAYTDGIKDMLKFQNIFFDSLNGLVSNEFTYLFELSTIFLCIRNFATCYSLHKNQPNFSRNSALSLGGKSLNINPNVYNILEESRLLATRGYGKIYPKSDINKIVLELDKANLWMNDLLRNENE